MKKGEKMATRNASASSMRVSARVKDMEQCSSLKKKTIDGG